MGQLQQEFEKKKQEFEQLINEAKTNNSKEHFEKLNDAAISYYFYKKYIPFEKDVNEADFNKIQLQIQDFSKAGKEKLSFGSDDVQFYQDIYDGTGNGTIQLEEKLYEHRKSLKADQTGDMWTTLDRAEFEYQSTKHALQNHYNQAKEKQPNGLQEFDHMRLREDATKLYFYDQFLTNIKETSKYPAKYDLTSTSKKASDFISLSSKNNIQLDPNKDLSIYESLLSKKEGSETLQEIGEKISSAQKEFEYKQKVEAAKEKFANRYSIFAEEHKIDFDTALKNAENVDKLDDYMIGLIKADNEERKKTQPDDAKRWFEDFTKILKTHGIDINNPYALGLVGVVDDFTPDQYDALGKNKQGKLDYAQTIVKPAFVKQDKDKNFPDFDGNNYAEFLHSNTECGANISDEKINYLYEMSKAGRLVIDDETSVLGNTTLNVIYSKDGMTMELKRNDLDWKSIKNKEYLERGISEKEMQAISGRMQSTLDLMSDARDIRDGRCTDLYNTKGQVAAAEEYSKNIWVDAKTGIARHAKDNPKAFESPEGRKLINDATVLSLKKDDTSSGKFYTAEEKKLAKSGKALFMQNITQSGIKKLIKKTGAKDISDLMNRPILDMSGKLIKADSVVDFQNKIGKHIADGNEVFIKLEGSNEFSAFKSSVVDGTMVAESGKVSYVQQMEDILSELHKTDSAFSRDSKEYKNLMAGFDAFKKTDNLDGLKKENGSGTVAFDTSLKNQINNIAKLGEAYQKSHSDPKKGLSDRQLARLTAINKLLKLNDCAQKEKACPANPEDNLAHNLVYGMAKAYLDSSNASNKAYGQKLLTDHNLFQEQSNKMKESALFKHIASGDPKNLEKLNSTNQKALFLGYQKTENDIYNKQHSATVNVKTGDGKTSEWTMLK